MSSPESKARVIGLLRPLKDVTVTAGETATFDCELSYEGIPVEWFLGGTKLEPSDRVSVLFCVNACLICVFWEIIYIKNNKDRCHFIVYAITES